MCAAFRIRAVKFILLEWSPGFVRVSTMTSEVRSLWDLRLAKWNRYKFQHACAELLDPTLSRTRAPDPPAAWTDPFSPDAISRAILPRVSIDREKGDRETDFPSRIKHAEWVPNPWPLIIYTRS